MKHLKAKYPDSRVIGSIPHIFLIVVVVTGLSWALDLSKHGVQVMGGLEYGLRAPAAPALSLSFCKDFASIAATISVIGFVETQMVSKMYADKHNYTVSSNRCVQALNMNNKICKHLHTISLPLSLPL